MDVSVRNGNEFDAAQDGDFVSVDDWVTFSINSSNGLGEISVTPSYAIMKRYVNT